MIKRIRTGLILAIISIAATPAMGQVPSGFIRFEADSLRITDDNRVVAIGNVRATYAGYTISSGKAVSDPDTNLATFQENVVLTAENIEAHGESMVLNLKTRDWQFISAESSLDPNLFQGYVRSPIYAKGEKLAGTEDDYVRAESASLTTCSLAEPHYVLAARVVEVYPGVKLIARKVQLYALGHKLFSLPAFSIPLNRLRSRTNLIPQVGQTQAEGAFLKTAYNYMATQKNTGIFKLDLMSKKGVGKGLEHSYTLAKGSGVLSAYHLFDRTLGTDSLTGRLSHKQQLGTVAMDLATDYRSNSYQYAPGSTSSNSDLAFTRNVDGANTQLRMHRNSSSSIGTFSALSSVLTHRQSLFGADTSFTFDYGQFENPNAASPDQELNSRLEVFRRLEAYDWKLMFNKRYDLDDDEFLGDERFSSLDRLPELTLSSETSRLGNLVPFGIPATFGLSVGKYHEEPFNVETERVLFDMNTKPRKYELASWLDLNIGAGFRQAFYGNDAAQYVLRANTDLTTKIGDKSNFVLRYRYQEPEGASAFRFDLPARYNVLTGWLNLRESKKLRLSLASGYNFAFKDLPWQDITLRARYSPSDIFSLYTSTGFDINRKRWRSLINQIQIRTPGNFKLDLGTRYDVERSQLGSARGQLETPIGKQMNIRAVAGYNGFTNKFDYRAIMITRDLHCWEASIAFVDQSVFFAEKGFQFNLRIKAFPIFDQFGVGQQGQSLTDTSLGGVF
ncbi:MAG: hypothetical protein Q7N50_03545 [Armatimonadota bacterium]|nr:hypothetical protein [Armatimonadota bacterium]